MDPTPSPPHAAARDALAERLVRAAAEATTLFSVYLGDRLGLYAALAAGGPQSAPELARRTGTAERYAREWLEQQAVAGLLAVEDAGAPPEARRFALPPGHDEVLADPESLDFTAPLAQTLAGVVRPLDQLVGAFRDGAGVPYEAYGETFVEGQARGNRALFLHRLGQAFLPAIPDVHARLTAGGRVADVGCGAGWSSVGIARAYPRAEVDGFDPDAASIARARANAAAYGVADRVRFHQVDAAAAEGHYDLVTAFECIHDLSDPVGVLATMRRLAGRDGAVLVMDERVAERFDPGAGLVEQLMYGWSVLHCLPVGLAGCTPAACAATGTVMRPDTLRRYAAEAGFGDAEALPLEHPFFRFYRLHRLHRPAPAPAPA